MCRYWELLHSTHAPARGGGSDRAPAGVGARPPLGCSLRGAMGCSRCARTPAAARAAAVLRCTCASRRRGDSGAPVRSFRVQSIVFAPRRGQQRAALLDDSGRVALVTVARGGGGVVVVGAPRRLVAPMAAARGTGEGAASNNVEEPIIGDAGTGSRPASAVTNAANVAVSLD